MAIKIQYRHDSAATWTSTNPVLASGEPGIETDTGKFKVGNGSTAWNSLAYTSVVGLTQTQTYNSFGDGSDGDVTISSGTTTLVQDMYYNNLTLTGTGKIDCNGFKIFVKDTLNLSNAGVAAIHANGSAGGAASGSTGGAVGAISADGSLRQQSVGTAGATGTSGVGTASAGVTTQNGNGGQAITAGSGGTSPVNNGGNGGGSGSPVPSVIRGYRTNMLRGATLLGGGQGARGGSSGGGDGINSGGGGGGGGTGGGVVALYVNKIVTSANTSPRAIQALGGNGGEGGTPSTGDCGGGGGGAGGGGGWVYIAYNFKFGPSILLIAASGGEGGKGGDGSGVGLGGGGGNGGYGGRVDIYCVPSQQGLTYFSTTNAIFNPEVTNSTASSLTSNGSNGGLAGLREVNF